MPAERESQDSALDAPSASVVENPKIIKLSNTEYYFPSPAAHGELNNSTDVNLISGFGNETESRRGTGTSVPFHSFTTISSQDYPDADDEELALTMPDLSTDLMGDERLTSFKDTVTRSVVIQPSKEIESDDDEWEEMLLYVELDDIPNVDELFAVEPDDFLTFQSKRQREVPKAKKPTLSELQLKFHNLDSSSPILQIGTRYYVGKYEEPMGSSLMFQPKEDSDTQPGTSSYSSSNTRPSQRLSSIIPEPRPPRDKVFHEKLCSNKFPEYELVANVSKVLKMTRKEVRLAGGDLLLLPPTPSGLPAPVPGDASWPVGYTATEILSGKYHANKNATNFSSSLDSDDVNSKTEEGYAIRGQKKTRASASISEDSTTTDEAECMELEETTPEATPGENTTGGPSILGLD